MPYYPKKQNALQTIFKTHYQTFEDDYDKSYADTYGQFRLPRIQQAVNRFLDCGDFAKGIARIKCTGKDCKHEYFRPFSCKQWYLCPSCHQKRILLLSEHLCEHVLYRLPHRQFVFTIPKALRIFFKYDRSLFSEISRLIYNLVTEYYAERHGESITTGAVVSYQSAGDSLRWNAHWHCIIMEGGLDDEDSFYHIPLKSLDGMVELFRHKVIGLLVKKQRFFGRSFCLDIVPR